MKTKNLSSGFLIFFLCAAILALSSQPARTDTVRIVVNGSQVQFDQPPIERSGRVFVPLRGVFERLGASVVYDNGTINATGNGRTIQLHIGSTQAVVNGQTQTLDVAPFLVGARTLVPLRFISEALGANVQYDNSSQVVSINSGQAPPPAQAPASLTLTNLKPRNGGNVQVARPAVSGGFSQPVDPNTVKLTLDGRDVSSTTYVSQNDFLFTPTYDLSQARHTVEVKGNSAAGAAFDRTWSFTSSATSNTNGAAANYLSNLSPTDGSTVGSTFTVSGTTLPNSTVKIAATGSALLGGVLRIGLGTYTNTVQADGNGYFSQSVNVQVPSGGNIAVRITSIAPNTNAGAASTLNLRS